MYEAREDEFCRTAHIADEKTHSKPAIDSFLSGLEPLYQNYVLDRRETKTSHRDIGTFYEHALNQVQTCALSHQFASRKCSRVSQAHASRTSGRGEGRVVFSPIHRVG